MVSAFTRALLVCAAMIAFAFSSSALPMPQNAMSAEIVKGMDAAMDHCAQQDAQEAGDEDMGCCEVEACSCPCMSISVLEVGVAAHAQSHDHGPSDPELDGISPAGLLSGILKPPPIS